jgi:hypothetical protein
MADLVTLAELKTHLVAVPASADDALLAALLNDVEALFESATLRAPGFYKAGEEITEVKDGTGTARLYLEYPLAEDGLVSIKLGYNSASPDETLNVASRAVVVYGEGSRVISRVDGGKFGRIGQPRYVEVVYEHADNLPADAKLAIKSVCAAAYQRRGSEEAQSETTGSFYSRTMLDDIASGDPFWKMAVAANTPVVIA